MPVADLAGVGGPAAREVLEGLLRAPAFEGPAAAPLRERMLVALAWRPEVIYRWCLERIVHPPEVRELVARTRAWLEERLSAPQGPAAPGAH